MELQVGEKVIWRSQSNGRATVKEGVVVIVVPAQVDPRNIVLPEGLVLPRNFNASPRNHTSYLIRVGKQKHLYWPLVKNLRRN